MRFVSSALAALVVFFHNAFAEDASSFRIVIGDDNLQSVQTVVSGRDNGVLVAAINYDPALDGQVQAVVLGADGKVLGGDIMGGYKSQVPYGATATADGAYLVVATGPGRRKRTESYLLRYEPDGDLVWTRTFYGAGGKKGKESFSVRAIDATPDGGALLAGAAWDRDSGTNEIAVIKVDVNGEVLSEHRYGSGPNAVAAKLFADADGGAVVLGSAATDANEKPQLFMLRIGSNGEKLAEISLTNSPMRNIILDAVRWKDDGFIVLRTESEKLIGSEIVRRLTAIDKEGDVLWEFTKPEGVSLFGVGAAADGTVIAVGSRNEAPDAKSDAWLGAIGDNGEIAWWKTFGQRDLDEFAKDIAPRVGGGAVIAGKGEGDILVFTMSAGGAFPGE